MSKRMVGGVMAGLLLGSTAAWADCWIIPKSQCPHAALAGKQAPGADMHEAMMVEGDLSGADFSGANLQAVNLYHGTLAGGNFSAANMRGIHLVSRQSDRSEAEWCEPQRCADENG